MPIEGIDTGTAGNTVTAGKCPFCLSSPCMCVFNGNGGFTGGFTGEIKLERDLSPTALDVLIAIKTELTDIKRLLQEKKIKEDLEEILKVHNR